MMMMTMIIIIRTKITDNKTKQVRYRAFSHDVTAAILVFQNNEMAAMLVFQTSPVGVELFSCVNALFCPNKFL